MSDGGTVPPIDDAALRVARFIVRWRQRIAPPGSRRARLARRLVSLTRRTDPGDRLRRQFLAWPEPRTTVTVWNGAVPNGKMLPDRPRILILKLDHIGDFAVALPALRHLRDAFPDAELTLACGPWNATLAASLGWFDHIVSFDPFDAARRMDPADQADRLTGFAALGLGTFDLAIDLRHEPDTRPLLAAVDAFARAGFQAPGFAGGNRLDLVMPDSQDALTAAGAPPLHAAVRLQALAAAVAAHFAPRTSNDARHLLRAGQTASPARYVVLAPGAGAPIKRWPIERLIELAHNLVEGFSVDIVIIGGNHDQQHAAEIEAALPPGRVSNMAGSAPLTALPDLLMGAALFIGYDTGPSHLAASLGVPTVCVFAGVSDPAVWHPLGETVTIVAGRAGCSPCRLTYADECPNGLACLTAIPVATVLKACERYLTTANAASRQVPAT
jgi:ADP-heptose:LPS heptosyltransferase